MSSDLSTEITAIATVILAAFAIVTAWYARKAFRAQSREVKHQADMLDEQREINAEQTRVLGLQAEELRQSLAWRKTSQACQVFIWTETGNCRLSESDGTRRPATDLEGIRAHLQNTSQQPGYDVEICWLKGTAAGTSPTAFPSSCPSIRLARPTLHSTLKSRASGAKGQPPPS